LHKAFRLLRSPRLNTAQALEKIEAEVGRCPEVEEVVRFIQSSERGVVK
jgi:UDP-N-acetylglucosamine acyltransferase